MIFVTAIHGDEIVPTVCLAENNLPQVVANPKAACLFKRFIDKDLNKSFGSDGNSYEEKRAKELLKIIPQNEIVIDFHTMSAKSDPFVIIVDLEMLPLALTTGLKHVVYMKYNIKEGHSLINYRKGLSIETGNHNTWDAYKSTLSCIKNIQKGKQFKAKIYEVYGIIDKRGKYKNFERCSDGFVPVLAGEKAYNILGLKSKIIQ
ncbi:MAG: succinylglutamate desuccinylase/aspartoacylase family protein [Nitrospirota bacterium]